jgi:hypothetical protein
VVSGHWGSQILGGTIAALMATAVVGFFVSRSGESDSSSLRDSATVTPAATYASAAGVVRGAGDETTGGGGAYGNRRFDAVSAFVFSSPTGLWLRIYSDRYTCASAFAASAQAQGLWFEAALSTDPEGTARLSLNTPLSDGIAGFEFQQRKDRTIGDHVDARIILTRIDTRPTGIWHGRVYLPPTEDVFGVRILFDGSFAAKWCAS